MRPTFSALEADAATSRDYPGLEFAVDVTELVGAPHSVEVRYEHAPDATAPDARHMGIVLDGVLHTGESFDAHTEHFGFARRHWSLGAADASRLVVGHAFAEGDYVANVAVRLHDADGLLMQHEETVRSAYAQDEFGRNHHSVAVARGGHLLAVGAPSYDNQAAPAPHSTANGDNHGVVQFFEYRESEEACAATIRPPIPDDASLLWLDNGVPATELGRLSTFKLGQFFGRKPISGYLVLPWTACCLQPWDYSCRTEWTSRTARATPTCNTSTPTAYLQALSYNELAYAMAVT